MVALRENNIGKSNLIRDLMASGATADAYRLRDNSIPVATFCYKADVASSEGANNVELVRLYDMACPYRTPAQQEDSRVRQGIDGFPIVIFWHDTVRDETIFMGKEAKREKQLRGH